MSEDIIMKHVKRIISLCLMLCICISGVRVGADNRYTEQSLEIESVSGTETYTVLNVDNRIYMSAADFGKITRYEYKEDSDNVLYTLGDKVVSVSKHKGKLSLPRQNYSAKSSKTVSYNGNTYLAMDELLPWLNVECSVADNKLIVTSDAISMWELTAVLRNNFETYKFDLYKDLGETNASAAGLAAAMIFDTIVNVRFDKLIPVGDSIFDPAGSLYDRECYRDLYIDMATDQSLLSAKADAVLQNVFEINKNIGTIEKAFGVDAEKIRLYGDSYLAEFGLSEEVSKKFDSLTNDWLEARKIIEDYEAHNPFKIMKSFETTIYTTNEYRKYLSTLCDEKDVDSVMKSGMREASIRLMESKGALYSYLIDLGYNKVSKKITNSIKKGVSETFQNTSWGSIFLYLDVAKIFYSTIVPVTDGMSEMSKFIIYSNVSDYSWDKAYEYAGKELTQDNIAFMCQSYMASLKSSKKAFEGMQTLFDSKAFGFSMFGNNDGLMDHRIEPTEEMLAQLALTSSCRENDSTENKDKKAKEIRELLKSFIKANDNTDTYNYKNYLGTWYYTRFSDPEPSDYQPLTITDKGNNKAEIKWYDGSIEEIVFISDNVAHGNTSISEYCAVEVPGGLSEERKNVPVVNVYDFTPVNGKESMYVCMRTTDTDRLVVAEWQSAVRSVEEVFSITEEVYSVTLEQAMQIAVNTSGYKYAAYMNKNEGKFYFFMTNDRNEANDIEEHMQRNGHLSRGIEQVIYSVDASTGKCIEEFSNVAFGSGQTENVQQTNSSEKDNFQKRYDALNSKSIKDAPQQEMNIQSGELYDEWDSLLNDVYQYLKTIKTSSEFETIKSDEVAWIKKKDAAVEASRNEYAGGSMASLAANTTAIKYIKDRCNYLISLMN